MDIITDPQIMDVIYYRITEGESLSELAKAWEVPYGKLSRWLYDDEGRSVRFAQALEARAHALAEEAIKIVDEVDIYIPASIQAAKLQAETRLKVAGKWDRKRYGDEKAAASIGNVTVVINRGLGVVDDGRMIEVVTAVSEGEFENAICEREAETVYVGQAPGDREKVGGRIAASENRTSDGEAKNEGEIT